VAGQLIATKLYLPRLRAGLVERPRLLERLRLGGESRLVLVSAPAGFGKTTVLTAWLHRASGAGHGVAWLSLDATDNEPTAFWTYVVTALQRASPSVGASTLDHLASSPEPTGLTLSTLLNELAAAPGEVWLVLDDYHLIENPQVTEAMAFLLDHLPAHVHVAISTRSDPDLPLARWRARGELVEIRAADLRFAFDEAHTYLNAVTGLDLAPADVVILAERTEGWIAALQLAALSLRGHEDVSGFITRFAGDDRYIVDYLIEEVLRHQPDAVRDFLYRSAVLDRLTGPLCDAVTGRRDGSDMLVALERANLFVVPLDDRREWYRYHHLFADVLRARLLSEQPDQVPLLHQRASRWYEQHELVEEAVRHALAARDFPRAAHLIELTVPAIRRDRREALMHGWLTSLPADAVRRSPVLSVFYGSMHLAQGELDGVEPRLRDAERALAALAEGEAPPWADTEELRTLPATIAIYRASVAQARGDVAGTVDQARRALDLAGPRDHLARGGAAGFLGLASWAQGDVPRALETFGQAVASLHAAGDLVDELSSTVVLADLWLAAGRPSKARRLCEHALERAEVQGLARAVADLRVGLSEIDTEVGDLEAARRHLEAAGVAGERAGMNEGRHRWFAARARVADAEGNPEEAVEFLDQAERLYRPGFFPDVRPIAAMRARIRIRHGALSEAADWARERGVSVRDDASYLSEFDHLTLVRLVLAQHRADQDVELDQTSGLLSRLGRAAGASGRPRSLVEIQLLQALVHDAHGDRPLALKSLGRALASAPEPHGYVRLYLDEGEPLMTLLREATQHGLTGDHGPQLLGLGRSAATATQDPAQGPAQSAGSLSERELQVLRLLDSELTGPQIAQQLFVSHNTVRTHTKHIFTKLDVTSRRGAVLRARERGLM
jgi:LuxR family maltose regulon positive regulatory protein